MKVLMLGGKGYIGSKITSDLLAAGHEVSVFDLCWFGNYTDVPCTVKDYKDIPLDTIEKYDAVIVLSAHSSVKMCIDDYISSYNNNVRNVLDLISKLRRTQKEIKLIYASSSSVYGNTNGGTADETKKEFICTNNYDLTKFVIDQYMLNNNPIPCWYALRFGTVNGFSPNFRSELMINSMTKSAIETDKIIISNKHINRAIVGTSDLGAVFSTLVEKATRKESGIYNINSFNATVEQIAQEVSGCTQSKIEDRGAIGLSYDFKISNAKFESTFGFKFRDSVESITREIKQNYNRLTLTNRDNGVKYE